MHILGILTGVRPHLPMYLCFFASFSKVIFIYCSVTHFADTYEEADENLYSAEVRETLNRHKRNGQGLPGGKSPIQLRAQLCRVAPFGENNKVKLWLLERELITVLFYHMQALK